jgi:predicted nucleotidyltransferase
MMQDQPPGNRVLADLLGITRRPRRKKITLNRRVLTFFFFLLLSVLFWFLTAMNREYTTSISYPVRYIRFPEKKVLVNDIPDRLELTVNAGGYTLLRNKLKSRIDPIIFDVNSFSLNTVLGDPSTLYILTSYAKDRIAKQLSEIEILNISPDSLFFQFADKASKKVPVEPDLDISFEKQYMQVGPYLVEPDSVTISGPEMIIDTIKAVATKEVIMSDANRSFDMELEMQPLHKVEFDPFEVWIQVPIEKFTEASLKVRIEVINMPESLLLRPFPPAITVSCQIGLSAYETLNEHLFRAVIDYAEVGNMLGNKLQVRIIKMPVYIQAVNFTPKSVEYIVER